MATRPSRSRRSCAHNPHSLTYSLLPQWLAQPLQAEVIDPAEAAEMWDLALLDPKQRLSNLPPHLYEAASRMWLYRMPVAAPRQ